MIFSANNPQFFAHVAAIRAWRETAGELPVGVKLLIEGEEEVGSPHLDATVRAHRDRLAADLVVTADGPVADDARPMVAFGIRGILNVELRARGARSDLHSGNWGGLAPNAAWDLVRLLATMLDAENRIAVPGVCDGIREPAPADRDAMDAYDAARGLPSVLGALGVDRLPPPEGVGIAERLMARPTLNLAGLTGGYGGPGSKTVIPSAATAKLDLRLVPDQDPDAVFAALAAHVARHAPGVELVRQGSVPPSATPLDHPMAGPVRRATARGFGAEPVDVPRLGASCPDATWTRTLGLPSFLVPYANSDEANHAPNENLVVERFHAGIRTTASLLAELAARTA